MKHIIHIILTAISIALAGLIFLISHEENVWLKWEWIIRLSDWLISISNSKLNNQLLVELLTYLVYSFYLVQS